MLNKCCFLYFCNRKWIVLPLLGTIESTSKTIHFLMQKYRKGTDVKIVFMFSATMTHFQKFLIIYRRFQILHNFSINVKINIGSCSFWIKIGTYSLPTVQWQRILPWHYVYTGCCRMYISTGQHTHLKSHQLWPSFFPPMTLPLFKTLDPGQLLPKSNTPLSFSPKEQNVVLWNTVVDRGSVYELFQRVVEILC